MAYILNGFLYKDIRKTTQGNLEIYLICIYKSTKSKAN